MTTIYDLPKPSNNAAASSKALSKTIQQEIERHQGIISFAQFMELALYHPTLGYYTAETMTLGKQGDFTTAPEISPLFAQCFAKQILQIQQTLNHSDILELGAGTGRFASDLLTALHKQDALPAHYYIYEISPSLRKKQQALLAANCPDFFQRILWLDTLPEKFTGTIIANEVLDALPVNLFRIQKDRIEEKQVAYDGKDFTWRYAPSTQPAFNQAVSTINNECSLYADYESEVCLQLQPFISAIANSLTKGIILFADYGYGRQEYYHPERKQGTLTCFYQHRHHENPLLLPGLQDITAHVDFTRVIEIASDHGCDLAGYTSQAAFLLACGLTDIAADLENDLSEADAFNLHQAIKRLTMPTEMGERVKIMALSKDIEQPLLGFRLHDRRRDL